MKLLKPEWVSHDGSPIFSVAIHPDGSRFATGGQGKDSGVVVIWNMAPVRSAADEANDAIPKVLCEMSNHLGCVNCVRWSYDGKWLASGGDDAIVMIWSVKYQGRGGGGGFRADLERWGCVHMLRGHSGDVLDLSWSPDKKYLASCSVDNTIVVWNARDLPQKLTTVTGHRGLVKGLTWDPVGKYLASQSDDRSIRIWRTSDWTEEKIITEPFRNCGGTTHILRLSWSPDGRYIVSAHSLNNDGPTAQIIERGDWKLGVDLVGHRKAVEVASFNPHLFFSDKGSKESNHGCIAVGSRDRSLSIWLTSLKRPLVVTHDLFVDSIIDISWSCDGYELMVCSTDGSLGYLSFSPKELGVRLPKQALDNLFLDIYGCSRASSRPALESTFSEVLIEDPAVLKHHTTTKPAVPDQKPAEDKQTAEQKPAEQKPAMKEPVEQKQNSSQQEGSKVPEPKFDSAKVPTITKQTETRTKDGKRRITPIMLTSQLASQDSTPRPFSSSTSTRDHSTAPRDKEGTDKNEAPGEIEGIQLLSPPAKPISFEPLSPKVPKTRPLATPLSPSVKTSSHKRRLESSEPLPRAKRQKKHKTVDFVSPTPSKPGTPQKGSGAGASHARSVGLQVFLSVPSVEQTLTVQLVPSGSLGSEPLNLEVDNTKPASCSVTCKRGADVRWSSSLLSRGVIATGNHCITCVVSEDQTMSVFSTQSGRLLLARFSLPSPPHAVIVSDYCVLLVTADANVRVWDMQKMKLLVGETSFSHLLRRSEKTSLSSCNLTTTGTPVVTLSNSTSYLYHRDMCVWMEVSNSEEISEIRSGIATDFEPTTTLSDITHLQRIQSAALSSHPTTARSLTRLRDTDSKLSTAGFLESQISRSLSLESPVEHRHWCGVYVRYLVREGLEERLREFCMQFCRPGGGGAMGGVEGGAMGGAVGGAGGGAVSGTMGGTGGGAVGGADGGAIGGAIGGAGGGGAIGGETMGGAVGGARGREMVLGFGVREMGREFLGVIAENAKLQRLYCELRDALD